MVIDKFVLDLSFTAISSNSSSFASTSFNAQGLPSFLSFGFSKLPDSILGSQPVKEIFHPTSSPPEEPGRRKECFRKFLISFDLC